MQGDGAGGYVLELEPLPVVVRGVGRVVHDFGDDHPALVLDVEGDGSLAGDQAVRIGHLVGEAVGSADPRRGSEHDRVTDQVHVTGGYIGIRRGRVGQGAAHSDGRADRGQAGHQLVSQGLVVGVAARQGDGEGRGILVQQETGRGRTGCAQRQQGRAAHVAVCAVRLGGGVALVGVLHARGRAGPTGPGIVQGGGLHAGLQVDAGLVVGGRPGGDVIVDHGIEEPPVGRNQPEGIAAVDQPPPHIRRVGHEDDLGPIQRSPFGHKVRCRATGVIRRGDDQGGAGIDGVAGQVTPAAVELIGQRVQSHRRAAGVVDLDPLPVEIVVPSGVAVRGIGHDLGDHHRVVLHEQADLRFVREGRTVVHLEGELVDAAGRRGELDGIAGQGPARGHIGVAVGRITQDTRGGCRRGDHGQGAHQVGTGRRGGREGHRQRRAVGVQDVLGTGGDRRDHRRATGGQQRAARVAVNEAVGQFGGGIGVVGVGERDLPVGRQIVGYGGPLAVLQEQAAAVDIGRPAIGVRLVSHRVNQLAGEIEDEDRVVLVELRLGHA